MSFILIRIFFLISSSSFLKSSVSDTIDGELDISAKALKEVKENQNLDYNSFFSSIKNEIKEYNICKELILSKERLAEIFFKSLSGCLSVKDSLAIDLLITDFSLNPSIAPTKPCVKGKAISKEETLSLNALLIDFYSIKNFKLYSELKPFERFLPMIDTYLGTTKVSAEKAKGIITQGIDYLDQMPYRYAEMWVVYANHFKIEASKDISEKEKKIVLESIRSLLPSLAAELEKIDPKHKISHIKRLKEAPFGGAMVAIAEDGLPEIYISLGLTSLPAAELQFILAHELAHYFLRHHFEMEPKLSEKPLFLKEGKENKEKLKLTHKMFENSYTRIQEAEADRFAILKLRAHIDAAINFFKKMSFKKESSAIYKKTFTSTHPLSADRIKNLEKLRDTVDQKSMKDESDSYKKSIVWADLKKSWVEKKEHKEESYPEYLLIRARKNNWPEEEKKAIAMGAKS